MSDELKITPIVTFLLVEHNGKMSIQISAEVIDSLTVAYTQTKNPQIGTFLKDVAKITKNASFTLIAAMDKINESV